MSQLAHTDSLEPPSEAPRPGDVHSNSKREADHNEKHTDYGDVISQSFSYSYCLVLRILDNIDLFHGQGM